MNKHVGLPRIYKYVYFKQLLFTIIIIICYYYLLFKIFCVSTMARPSVGLAVGHFSSGSKWRKQVKGDSEQSMSGDVVHEVSHP